MFQRELSAEGLYNELETLPEVVQIENGDYWLTVEHIRIFCSQVTIEFVEDYSMTVPAYHGLKIRYQLS